MPAPQPVSHGWPDRHLAEQKDQKGSDGWQPVRRTRH